MYILRHCLEEDNKSGQNLNPVCWIGQWLLHHIYNTDIHRNNVIKSKQSILELHTTEMQPKFPSVN